MHTNGLRDTVAFLLCALRRWVPDVSRGERALLMVLAWHGDRGVHLPPCNVSSGPRTSASAHFTGNNAKHRELCWPCSCPTSVNPLI